MTVIWIEDSENGKDADFLRVVIKKLFPNLLPEIKSMQGYTNFENNATNFKRNTEQGIKNLVIFDADDNTKGNDGGFQSRKEYILRKKQELNLEFELFLLPNNKDDGDFELLQEKIISLHHIKVFKCFENYKKCLKKHVDEKGVPLYQEPDNKSKMYAYVDSFVRTNKQEKYLTEGKWFSEFPEIWNFDQDYLDAIKQFLFENLK